MRALLWVVLGGLALLCSYWGLLFLAQRRLLFPAPPLAGLPARPADARQVWLQTSRGRVEAWFLPPFASSGAPAGLLLFAHGNGEVIDVWPAAFAEARGWGLGVLLVEYPGYGRSAGRPSEAAITETMLAAHDWAGREPGVDPGRIAVYGRSLGGGAACALAARRPVRAVILESAFESVRAFAADYWAPPFLVLDPFDNLAFARAYRGPLLLLHGSGDEIVPPRHSRALAQAAPQAELHLMPCGHNDCSQPWPVIRAFLERHGVIAAASPSGG